MSSKNWILPLVTAAGFLAVGCVKEPPVAPPAPFEATYALLGNDFPLNPPLSYERGAPDYIQKDNLGGATLDDKIATLGRVLFYDRELSANKTIACSSCHLQEFAFSDTAKRSVGLDGGLTHRHAMRLINVRFAVEQRMFWDERASNLLSQVTVPIEDHLEMGFSGTQGQPGMDSLLHRLSQLPYYRELFAWAFDGDSTPTSVRLAHALTQFVASIESFDSKFDEGYEANNGSVAGPFSNFTPAENQGKQLFLAPPQLNHQGVRTGGGAGCAGCHAPPEFDIDPNSRNNGVDATAADPNGLDASNTRAPTLRDVLGPSGLPNGPMMHTGNFIAMETVIEHYNEVVPQPGNTNVDPRLLAFGGQTRKLELTGNERAQLEAFLKTLTGTTVYTETRWSNPF